MYLDGFIIRIQLCSKLSVLISPCFMNSQELVLGAAIEWNSEEISG